MATYLRGPQYSLGEHDLDHTAIENLAERAAEFGIPVQASLWGWGHFRRTERDLAQQWIDAGRAALGAATVAPGEVEAVVLCSTRIEGTSESHGELVERVLTGLGCGDVAFYDQLVNRCTNLLTGIDLATALVAAGRFTHVLVVTADSVADEAERLGSYAIFSDAAAGAVVSVESGPDAYRILGCASAQDVASLEWSKQISAQLGKEVNQRLLDPHEQAVGELDALLSLNIFLPLVTMKERQAGFVPAQLYLDNVTRLGHCFAADPLINLVDLAAAGRVRPGGRYELAASVPGSRFGVLLEREE